MPDILIAGHFRKQLEAHLISCRKAYTTLLRRSAGAIAGRFHTQGAAVAQARQINLLNSQAESPVEGAAWRGYICNMIKTTNETDGIASQPHGASLLPQRHLLLAVIPLGIALNLGVGTTAQLIKLPIYLDAIGTIAMTLLLGMRAGILVGVLSFLIGGLLVSPVLPWFSGTQAAIAIYVAIVARRGGFKTTLRVIFCGIGLGVVAAIVSAPVIVAVYGGVDGSGASVITAFLIASGKKVIESVFLSGLAVEPVDKLLQCLLAVWLIKGLPKTIIRRFNGDLLEPNNLKMHRSPGC
ncbi:MAG: ECF transporter S component [Verrucomicrobia bacterium]|nr:ECF transporter S component [Verrucomicrobiota bacterium]